MSINSLVNSLGKKEKVYVSVTQSVGMEVFQVDENSGHITKYASKHLEYDNSTKEIADLERFRENFLELLTELGIKPTCDVVLNLPTVLLGTRELPSMLEDVAVGQSILAEIDGSYIFNSRYTPVFDWKDFETGKNTGMRNIFYCALQDNIISKIIESFKEVGLKIVDIETSYTTILNGLARTNLIENQLQPDKSWNLMIVNDGGYAIFSMMGDKIIDFVQEDMQLMDERSDDIYNVIASTAELTLLGFPASSLVVVSETDQVSAEELATSLTSTGSLQYQDVVFIDDNLYRKDEFLPLAPTVDPKYKLKPSLKTIGMLQGNKLPIIAKFDFLKIAPKVNYDNEIVRFNIGDHIFEITPNRAKIYAAAVAGVLLVILVPLFLLFPALNKPFNDKITALESQISELDKEITDLNASEASTKFNPQEEIKNVLANNRTKLISYITIGEVIPRKLWITYYKTHSKDKIIIAGVSGSIDDINNFYKNINNTLPNSKLQLKNMEMNNTNGEDAAVAEAKYYDFIITNDPDYPPKAETVDADDKDKNAKGKSKKKK
ncbi:MAG: PilN domain-containing protein [Fusobacterium sp.]|nr:PilN domain-containing protein [Fusobacterium sp.]